MKERAKKEAKRENKPLQWFKDRIGKTIYREPSHIPGMNVEIENEDVAMSCYKYQKTGIFTYRGIK